MKLLFILAAGAFAADIPRIELDLSQMETMETASIHQTHSVSRDHDLGYTQPDGQAVGSRQDWTERCTAGPTTSISTCPFPVARAWDHQDRDISAHIETRVYLVDVDGNKCGTEAYDCGCDEPVATNTQCKVSSVQFGNRATYLFKYDVTDSAGNHAEQVVFALILDDACGANCDPTIDFPADCGEDLVSWEAASDTDYLCQDITAEDNIDSDATMMSHLLYDITRLDGEHEDMVQLCKDESYLDYKNTGEGCAKQALNTSHVGKYLINFHVCDEAGIYGSGPASASGNCVQKERAIIIRDTELPVIQVHGETVYHQECHHKNDCPGPDCHAYQDRGAKVWDALDTEALGRDLSVPCNGVEHACLEVGFDGSPVDSSVPDTYTITYNAWDSVPLKAIEKTRQVIVRDTLPPSATLLEPSKILHYSNADADHTPKGVVADADIEFANEDGFTCSDDCDQGTIAKTMSWKDGKELNDSVEGEYTRIYTCTDNKGLSTSVERVYEVVDKGVPEITVMGHDYVELPASRTLEYTDQGATCEDYVDGTLSHAVEVSGQVVNMRIPGTYTIYYDCQDLSGNAAPQMTRVVKIKDNSCPEITLNCDNGGAMESPCATQPAPIVYVEAGFDYQDAGAIATDDLDGDITSDITTDGNTVKDQKTFYSRRSCTEIKRHYAGATTGEYFITTFIGADVPNVGDKARFSRQLVWCDMDSLNDDGVAPGYTFKKCSGCRAIHAYAEGFASEQNDCSAWGLELAILTGKEASVGKMQNTTGADPYALYVPRADETAEDLAARETNDYLCSTNDENIKTDAAFDAGLGAGREAHADHWKITGDITEDQITRAEAGKYVIKYHVFDSSGNAECHTPERTVIVKDTLPPVITLHMDGGLIHTGNGGVSSPLTGSQDNPADNPGGENDHLADGYVPAETAYAAANSQGKWQGLMAEQRSSGMNAWALAGLASAVTGLALLGVSMRRAEPQIVEV